MENELRALCSGRESFRVPTGYRPPPRLQGKSCVYVLQLCCSSQVTAHRRELYVGESDAIGRRLQEHRKKFGAGLVNCVFVEVASKSEALLIESLAIERLKQLGCSRVRNVQQRAS